MKYELMHRKIPSAVIEINDSYGYLSKIEHIYEPDHMPVGVIDEKGRSELFIVVITVFNLEGFSLTKEFISLNLNCSKFLFIK